MGKKNRPKLEKKRKALKKQRKARVDRHGVQPLVTAYSGNKYRTADLVPLHLATESGIHEADVLLESELTDAEVAEAIQRLVVLIRSGHMPDLHNQSYDTITGTEAADVVFARILARWQDAERKQALPGGETLVGVLRSILGSMETWKMAGRDTRGYLIYLTGFLKKAGVDIRAIPAPADEADDYLRSLLEQWKGELDDAAEADEGPEDDDFDDAEPGEPASTERENPAQELLSLAADWRQANEPEAGVVFRNYCLELIDRGQARLVAELCRRLIGEDFDPVRIADYSALANAAGKRLEGREASGSVDARAGS